MQELLPLRGRSARRERLSIKVNEEFKALGHGVWTPVRVTTMWGEAENAKIPVLGAGYRGLFSGPGFDAMWTDMSEIVRPTRDGIHGREFISTAVDLGRKPSYLTFDKEGRLTSPLGTIIDLPVPFLLDISRLEVTEAMLRGIAGAASELGTLLVLPIDQVNKLCGEILPAMIVPIISKTSDLDRLSPHVRMVEMEASDSWRPMLKDLKDQRPGMLVGVRIRSSPTFRPASMTWLARPTCCTCSSRRTAWTPPERTPGTPCASCTGTW